MSKSELDIFNNIPKEKIKEFASRMKGNEGYKDLDDEAIFWNSIIKLLFAYSERNTKVLWEEYAKEVKTKSRFFPKAELLDRIKDIADKATRKISKGEVLFRSREYSKDDLLGSELLKPAIDIMKKEFPEDFRGSEDIFDESFLVIVAFMMCYDEEKWLRIAEKLEEVMNSTIRFYGYDSMNSDAPRSEISKDGRANPRGISYLYTSMDYETAVLELRPQLHSMYSIAKVELIRDVKVFDFTYNTEEQSKSEFLTFIELKSISEEFSKPNTGDQFDYVPTQLLCEYIRELGFDGIIYKSAVAEFGKNVLLFNTDESSRAYNIVGSEVKAVEHIDITLSSILPLKTN